MNEIELLISSSLDEAVLFDCWNPATKDLHGRWDESIRVDWALLLGV